MIVGLGNIGPQYDGTRHNTGFMVVEKFAQEHNIKLKTLKMNAKIGSGHVNGEKIMVVEPTTFMNLSGEAVQPLMHYYKIDTDDMIVAHDDMDLPVGKIRLRNHGSAGGHNGIKSIIHSLGTYSFNRIRVGTSHPKLLSVDNYVLSPFTVQQKPKFEKARANAVSALDDWIAGMPFNKLENKYN